MSDEPQDPKFIEPPGEPTPDAKSYSSSEQPSQTGESPREETQADSAADAPINRIGKPQKPDSGGLIRRLTGSLRRLTGPLGNTGWLGGSEPLEEKSVKPADVHEPTGKTIESQRDIEGEAASEERSDLLPQKPLEDLPQRRLTGPLSDSGPTGDTGALIEPSHAKEQPEEPRPSQESPDAQRRLTGPLGNTGLLGDTGPLPEPPKSPTGEDWIGEVRREAAEPPEIISPAEDLGEGQAENWDQAPDKSLDTAELQRRLTGPLEDQGPVMETGKLEDSGSLPESSQAPSDEPAPSVWNVEMPEELPEAPPAETGWTVDLPGVTSEIDEPDTLRSVPPLQGEIGELPESDSVSELQQPQAAPDWLSEVREAPSDTAEPGPEPVDQVIQPDVPEVNEEILQPGEGLAEPPAVTPTPSPPPMSPFRRVTGSLRRIITGALGKQSQPEQPEISDDLMAGRLEQTLTSEPKLEFRPGKQETETPTPEKPTTGSLVRRVTGSLRRVTGSLRTTSLPVEPPKPPDQPQVVHTPWQPPQEPPKQSRPADMDWMSELRKEPEGLIEEGVPEVQAALESSSEAGTEVSPAGVEEQKQDPLLAIPGPLESTTEQTKPTESYIPSPPPMSTLRRVTGSLRRIITGALGKGPKNEEQEISDDMVAGRLEHTLTAPQKRDLRLNRQEIAEEETEPKTTGSLIRRVTGSLRRITGSLRGPTAPKEPVVPQVQPVPWQVPETPPAEETRESSTREGRAGEAVSSEEEQVNWQREQLLEDLEGKPLTGDEPISLLESGAIAALDEVEKPSIEPDWMKSIRGETRQAGEGDLDEEKPGLQRMTGSLRKLIRDVMGSGETPEVLDFEQEMPGAVESGIDLGESDAEVELSSVSYNTEEEEVFEDEMAFLDGLEARFGQFEDVEIPEENIEAFTSEPEEVNPYAFLDQEDLDIWGETGQAASHGAQDTVIEDGWNIPAQPPLPPELSKRLWGEIVEEEAVQPAPEAPQPYGPEDFQAAQFLTGEEIETPEKEEEVHREYLRDALEKSEGEESGMSVQDIRAIALEDYEETEPGWDRTIREETVPVIDEEVVAPSTEAAGTAVEVEDDFLSEPAWNFNTWIASHSRTEKILLVEAAVVILALLVSVPFLISMIVRGSTPQQAGAFTTRPLSDDLPYPTNLVLPGGWTFALQKSTISDGQWKPAASEWLEGTELRRVVALPWNTQTEAVIRTFQPGDPVELGLSNGRMIKYKVDSVERVPVSDASIMADPKPSLVIILYEENTDSRWVVICKP